MSSLGNLIKQQAESVKALEDEINDDNDKELETLVTEDQVISTVEGNAASLDDDLDAMLMSFEADVKRVDAELSSTATSTTQGSTEATTITSDNVSARSEVARPTLEASNIDDELDELFGAQPNKAIENEEPVFNSDTLPEAQGYFSEQGFLTTNAKAQAVRQKLDHSKEMSRLLSANEGEVPHVPNSDVNSDEQTNKDQQTLSPILCSLALAASSFARAGVAMSSKPKAMLDAYRSKERRFARYNVKSTKAQRKAMSLAGDMIKHAETFKAACKDIKIKPNDLSVDNIELIAKQHGSAGKAMYKSYEKLSDAVVEHELALVDLDELTSNALKNNALGLNTLARQNEAVRNYSELMEATSESFEDVPLFGAKKKIDEMKSLKEKLVDLREKLSVNLQGLGDLFKQISEKLKALFDTIGKYIETMVSDVKSQRRNQGRDFIIKPLSAYAS